MTITTIQDIQKILIAKKYKSIIKETKQNDTW